MLLSEFVHGFICFFEQPKKGGCDFWHWELSYVLHLVKYGHLGGMGIMLDRGMASRKEMSIREDMEGWGMTIIWCKIKKG